MTASAKSLFKATRPKARATGTALPMDMPDHARPQNARRALDLYPTGQPEAIRALLSRDGAAIRDAAGEARTVWEPAAGHGDLSREIIAAGLNVINSDIADHGCPGVILRNFYEWDYAPASVIITNPPYDQINARDGHGRWLRHTLALPQWRYLALLLSWDWPAARSNGLGQLLDDNPFTRTYLMRWKLDFTGEGSPPQRNAWFIWDRDDPRATDGTKPHPDFCWLDREDARQGGLF